MSDKIDFPSANLKVFEMSRKNARIRHRKLYYILPKNGVLYAVSGVNEVTIRMIPDFYTSVMFFSVLDMNQIMETYLPLYSEIKYLTIQEFLALSRD